MKDFSLYIYTVNKPEAASYVVEAASRKEVIEMVYANEKYYDFEDNNTTVRVNLSHIVKLVVKERQKATARGW